MSLYDEVGVCVHKLERAMHTLRAMLTRRGYTELKNKKEDLKDPNSFIWISDTLGKICCTFTGDWDSTTRIKTVEKFAYHLEEENIPRGILIAGIDITTQAAQHLRESKVGTGAIIEFFTLKELSHDIMEHYLMPKYRLLTDTQATALRKRCMVNEDQLPEMRQTDPVARYFGLQPTQILEVTRSNDSCGTEVLHRVIR
jgi:DNA-directed RNA polymerase subunit H (RpoH/RPB5)